VELIRLSGSVETEAGDKAAAQQNNELMQGVGPQVPGVGDTTGSVSGQDEVDDLLSSLGF